MKSAEEFVDKLNLKPADSFVRLIRERDLEAYRAGMTQAAEIAREDACKRVTCASHVCITARTIAQRIEQARDRKTGEGL